MKMKIRCIAPVESAADLPACSICKALRGDPCRTPGDRTRRPHADRYRVTRRNIAGLPQPRAAAPRLVTKRLRLDLAEARAQVAAARSAGKTWSDWIRGLAARELEEMVPCAMCGAKHSVRPDYVGYEDAALCAQCDPV